MTNDEETPILLFSVRSVSSVVDIHSSPIKYS